MTSPLYEMLPKDVRTLVPRIYGSDVDLGPQELARRVCDFIDQCLAGDEPKAAAWLDDAQREIAAYLTGNPTTVYDQVNAARDYSPAYLEAAAQAAQVGREGGVHLELGTWKSFPPERTRAITEHDGLAEFIRLDLDSSYGPEVVADCASLPFVERSIDRIASNSLLEHVAYPHDVITESFRVLRAGGAMIITVPFHFVLHGCPQDFLRYTPAFFDKVCREAGFDRVVCETHAYGGLYYTLHQAVKAAIVREDLPLDEARSMRRLHTSLTLMLAALTPLDSRFVNAGRQFFHSVSCIAFKPGTHAPRGRECDWEKSFLDRALDLLACPACKSTLRREASDLACAQCNRRYPIHDGIPLFVEPAPAEPEYQGPSCARGTT